MFVSEAVPFKKLGNRRCLTEEQLAENPELSAFVNRFRDSFEHDPLLSVWRFIEPDGVNGH